MNPTFDPSTDPQRQVLELSRRYPTAVFPLAPQCSAHFHSAADHTVGDWIRGVHGPAFVVLILDAIGLQLDNMSQSHQCVLRLLHAVSEQPQLLASPAFSLVRCQDWHPVGEADTLQVVMAALASVRGRTPTLFAFNTAQTCNADLLGLVRAAEQTAIRDCLRLRRSPVRRESKLLAESETTPSAAADCEATERTRIDAWRQRILSADTWLSSADVSLRASRIGAGATNPSKYASSRRVARTLFGIWDGKRYRYPEFQMDAHSGLISPKMAKLLEVLGELLDRDPTGWQVAFWLYTPSADLADAEDPEHRGLPAAVFKTDPDRVIALARATFGAEAAHLG